LSFHDRILVDENEKKLDDELNIGYSKRNLSGRELIIGKYPPTLSLVVRRSLLVDFPWPYESISNIDTYMIAILGQFGGAYFHSDLSPAAYRIHSGGLWSQEDKSVKP